MSLSSPSPLSCPRCHAPVPAGDRLGGHCGACLLELTLLAPETTGPTSVSDPWIQLPGFELFEELGRGGSGVVYRGRQLSLDRPIAVKILRGAALAHEVAWQRFQREAQAAGRLQHPAIVRVFDTGTTEGLFWLSMEYIEGRNLEDLGNEGRFSANAAATLVRTLAEAIMHAHSAGVLHRDLKPSNVILDRAGRPHITDFGLASLMHEQEETGASLSLTRPGQTLGSPGYAAPELSLDGTASPVTDVYGLGAILYHALSGEPPVQGKTLAAIFAQQRESEPLPLRHFNRDVPRDLELICAKCLRREPHERYASAADLARDLGHFLAGERIEARAPSALDSFARHVRRRPGLAALGLTSGLLVVSLIWSGYAWQRRQQEQERRTVLLSESKTQLRHRQAGHRGDALRQLQEAWRLRPGSDLSAAALAWAMLPEIGPRETSSPPPDTASPTLTVRSPDGTRIAVIAADALSVEIRSAETGEVQQRLIHPLPVTSVDWAGELIATGCENRFVYIWDETGRLRHRLSGHQGVGVQVKFRPRSQELVSVAADQYIRIWHAALGTEVVHREVEHPAYEELAWSQDGETLLARAGSAWDRYRIEWPRLVDVLAPPSPEPHTENLGSAAFDRTGSLAAVADEEQLRVWDFARGLTVARFKKSPGQWLSAGFTRTQDSLWLCGWDQPLEQITLLHGAEGWRLSAGQRRRHEYGALLRDGDAEDQQWLLSQNGTGQFIVYAPGRERSVTLKHEGTLAGVLSPEGTWAATSSYQTPGLRIWSLPEGKLERTLSPEATARQLLFLPGQRLLVDTTLGPRLYSTATWQALSLPPLPATLASMTVSYDGRWLITLGAEHLQLWSAIDFREALRLPWPEHVGWPGDAHLVASRGSPRLLLHTAEGTVVRWHLDEVESTLRALGLWPEPTTAP